VSVVCRQVEISAKSRSLVQRSPADCVVSECELETSKPRQRKDLGPVRLSKHAAIKNKNISTSAFWLTRYFDERKI
jgi:hypothetical protein